MLSVQSLEQVAYDANVSVCAFGYLNDKTASPSPLKSVRGEHAHAVMHRAHKEQRYRLSSKPEKSLNIQVALIYMMKMNAKVKMNASLAESLTAPRQCKHTVYSVTVPT